MVSIVLLLFAILSSRGFGSLLSARRPGGGASGPLLLFSFGIFRHAGKTIAPDIQRYTVPAEPRARLVGRQPEPVGLPVLPEPRPKLGAERLDRVLFAHRFYPFKMRYNPH